MFCTILGFKGTPNQKIADEAGLSKNQRFCFISKQKQGAVRSGY
jgi:hypothetical protein